MDSVEQHVSFKSSANSQAPAPEAERNLLSTVSGLFSGRPASTTPAEAANSNFRNLEDLEVLEAVGPDRSAHPALDIATINIGGRNTNSFEFIVAGDDAATIVTPGATPLMTPVHTPRPS